MTTSRMCLSVYLCFSSQPHLSHLLVIVQSDHIQLTQIFLHTSHHIHTDSKLAFEHPRPKDKRIVQMKVAAPCCRYASHLVSLLSSVLRFVLAFRSSHTLVLTTWFPAVFGCRRTQTLIVREEMWEINSSYVSSIWCDSLLPSFFLFQICNYLFLSKLSCRALSYQLFLCPQLVLVSFLSPLQVFITSCSHTDRQQWRQHSGNNIRIYPNIQLQKTLNGLWL